MLNASINIDLAPLKAGPDLHWSFLMANLVYPKAFLIWILKYMRAAMCDNGGGS